MTEEPKVPVPTTSASDQERSERPLPAVIPSTPGEGLSGFELPEALREVGESGLRGIAWTVALRWVEQQTMTMRIRDDELRRQIARNDALSDERDSARLENAVLKERLNTRWVTYATGFVAAVLLSAAWGIGDDVLAWTVAGMGALLLMVTVIELRRRS